MMMMMMANANSCEHEKYGRYQLQYPTITLPQSSNTTSTLLRLETCTWAKIIWSCPLIFWPNPSCFLAEISCPARPTLLTLHQLDVHFPQSRAPDLINILRTNIIWNQTAINLGKFKCACWVKFQSIWNFELWMSHCIDSAHHRHFWPGLTELISKQNHS